jgi:hypothetical protein
MLRQRRDGHYKNDSKSVAHHMFGLTEWRQSNNMRSSEIRFPRCFMHVPKCAGMSFHAALETALPTGSICPRRMDTSTFCDFRDFDLLPPLTRALVAANDAEIRSMRSFPFVSGHFSLAALLQITDATLIGTILREPRARLLSLYTYWRIPKIFDHVLPYDVGGYAREPPAVFFSDSRLAPAIDNQICRMLLQGDPRIPYDAFIAATDVYQVANDSIERLDRLGFVGVLELGSSAWQGLGNLFGVAVNPTTINVTSELGSSAKLELPDASFTSSVRDLIEQRNAGDRMVYDHALKSAGLVGEEGLQFANAAFHAQLSRTQDSLQR